MIQVGMQTLVMSGTHVHSIKGAIYIHSNTSKDLPCSDCPGVAFRNNMVGTLTFTFFCPNTVAIFLANSLLDAKTGEINIPPTAPPAAAPAATIVGLAGTQAPLLAISHAPDPKN